MKIAYWGSPTFATATQAQQSWHTSLAPASLELG